MDNTDKMEDWRMLTAGRKSAARSRMRKEKDNVRMTGAKRVEWVKCAERAGQIWATVTLGRWLRALSSVYITLTDQAKTATRQKWSLVGARCASAGERLLSGRLRAQLVRMLFFFLSLHARRASATVLHTLARWDSHNARISIYATELTGSN